MEAFRIEPRVLKSNCCNDIYDPISKETKIPYLLLPRKIGKCSLFKCRFPKPRFLELQVLLVWWHVIPFDTWVVAWLEVLEHLRRQRKKGMQGTTGGNDKHKNFPKWWKGMWEGETLCWVIFDSWDTIQKSMMLVTCTLEVFHSAPCESFGRLQVQLFRRWLEDYSSCCCCWHWAVFIHQMMMTLLVFFCILAGEDVAVPRLRSFQLQGSDTAGVGMV